MASIQPEAVQPVVPAPSGSPVPSAESRRHRLGRHGHRVGLYAGAVALVALLAALIVLISKNTGSAKLDWAFGSTHASLVWIILGAAIIGWLLGIMTAVVFRYRTRRP